MKTILLSITCYLSIVYGTCGVGIDSCYYINTSKDTVWMYGGEHLFARHPHQILLFSSKEKVVKQKVAADTISGFGRYEKTKTGRRLIHYRALGVPYKQSMCMHLQEVLYDSAGVCIVTDWKCTGSSDILVSRVYYRNQYMYTIDKTNWPAIRRAYFPDKAFPFEDKKAGAYTLRKCFTGR